MSKQLLGCFHQFPVTTVHIFFANMFRLFQIIIDYNSVSYCIIVMYVICSPVGDSDFFLSHTRVMHDERYIFFVLLPSLTFTIFLYL